MNPWRRLTCHISPIITALAISYVLVSLFGDRYHPREVLDVHIEPVAGIEAGTSGAIVVTAIDDRKCDGNVRRYFIDSKGRQYALPDSPAIFNTSTASGTQFPFSRELAVPVTAAPGVAGYRSETSRWCNIWQHYIWPMTDEYKVPFMILPARHAVLAIPVAPAVEVPSIFFPPSSVPSLPSFK